MRDFIRLAAAVVLMTALTGCGAGKVEASAEAVAEPDLSGPIHAKRAATAGAAATQLVETPFVETQIIDEQGFGQRMIAVRAQIPGDWQTRGGVMWDRRPECVSNHQRLNWIAVSPDGRQAIEVMPGLSWQVQGTDIEMNPCPPLAIRSTQQFLQMIAQRYPGARVIKFRDRPEFAQPARQGENGARTSGAAGELLIAYQSGAAEIRELLTTSLMISELQGNIVVTSPVVYAYRVAGVDPDPAFSDRFIKSLKADSQWLAQVQQTANQLVMQIAERQRQNIASWHANQMARINAGGAADRAQIRAQTNREVAQIYSNIWSNSQATDERIQRRTLESIGGYNTYADPSGGGVVRGSIEHDRVLRTPDGNYIATDDPYLNPAGSEELQRIP